MNANDYQAEARRTLIDAPDQPFTAGELQIILQSLAIAAAVGKVLEYVKKAICHRHGYDHRNLITLLSDVDQAMSALTYNDQDPQQLLLSGNEQMILWCALGLAGEAGEAVESASMVAHFDLFDHDDLIKELGDCDWYNAALCSLIDVGFDEPMRRNIAKLRDRYPNGYSSADSQARVDQQIPDLPWPETGDKDTCKMCGRQIVYIRPYWDHPGEIKPRHPAIPVRYRL